MGSIQGGREGRPEEGREGGREGGRKKKKTVRRIYSISRMIIM
jgi:hypothetical protein